MTYLFSRIDYNMSICDSGYGYLKVTIDNSLIFEWIPVDTLSPANLAQGKRKSKRKGKRKSKRKKRG